MGIDLLLDSFTSENPIMAGTFARRNDKDDCRDEPQDNDDVAKKLSFHICGE